MTVIDIGPGATDRASAWLFNSRTSIDLANPANAAGHITSVELYCVTADGANVKVGTFSGAGTDYTYRASATIGSVTKGSKQTFSGLEFDVESGDFLGAYGTAGYLEAATSGGSGVYYKSGDHMSAEGAQTYTAAANYVISIYGTGATPDYPYFKFYPHILAH